ncbi:MAG: TetR/AcrR family transcriptional regulator [Actinomycetota bacterium]|nr:TetR/AcrR family transcriptional regulator [Actinomycetota bacterium]
MTQPQRAERGRPGTRDALLDAVDAIVAERGYAACSLQAVARRAGLTTGAVYSTFGSRGALLAAANERRSADAGLPADEPDLRKAVSALARNYYDVGQNPERFNLVLAQLDLVRLGFTDPGVAESLHETYTRMHAALADDLERRAGGSLPGPGLEVSQRLVAVLQGLMLQSIAFGGDIPERVFVEAALAAVRS